MTDSIEALPAYSKEKMILPKEELYKAKKLILEEDLKTHTPIQCLIISTIYQVKILDLMRLDNRRESLTSINPDKLLTKIT